MKILSPITTCFLVLLATSVYAQITGPTPIYAGSTQQYTWTGGALSSPVWQIGNGTKISQSGNSVTVTWNTNPTTGAVILIDAGIFKGTLSVTLVPPPTVPPAVPAVSPATSITSNSFIANWGSSSLAESYRLDVSTSSSFGSFVNGYNNLSVSGTSQAVTGLNAGTTYYYRVRAYNSASGTSSNSNTVTAITVPAPPVAASAFCFGSTSFTATWNAATGATSYRLDVSTSNSFYSFVSGYNNMTVSGTSQSVTGLTSGTTYYYRVRAVNVSGTSGNSNTTAVNPVPSAPTGTGASRCGTGTVTLSASSGTNGNTVRWYSASSGGTPLTTATSYTTPSISATTTYYISSYNSTTQCESTSARVAVVATVNPVPSAPTGTGGSVCGSGTVSLSASPGTNGNTVRWYSASSGGTPLTTAASYTTPGISVTTTYYISSYNSTTGCESTSARVAVVATVDPVPSAPTGTGASRCGTGTVTLDASPGTNGNTVRWYSASSGGTPLTTAASYTTPSISATTTYYISSYNSTTGCESTSARVAVVATVNPVPSEPTGTGGSVCGSGIVSLSGTPGSNGNTLRWYAALSGGTPLTTAMTYSPSISNTTTYYISSYNNVTGCESTSARVAVTGTVNAVTIGGTLGGNIEAYGVAIGTLTLSGHTGAVLKWQQKIGSGNWTDISNTNTTQAYSNVTTTTYYRAVVKSGACAAANSAEAAVIIHAIPTISIQGSSTIVPGSNTNIVASSGLYSYQWYRNDVPVQGATSSTLTVTTPGLYKVAVKATSSSPTYTTGNVEIFGSLEQDQNVNYIRITVFNIEGMTPATSLYDLNVEDFAVTTAYFDGLGRPMQNVSLGAGGNGNDLIQHVAYDSFGREAKKYLPYVHSARDGRYQSTAPVDQSSFYAAGTATIPADAAPYSETIFEPSPLNRVVKQGAPGAAWQPDANNSYTSTDRTIKAAYGFNQSNEVLLWTYTAPTGTYPLGIVNTGTGTTPAYYAANQLYKNKTKDEQHHEVIEYTDKLGRTVLKRVQATTTANPSTTDANKDTNWASTYYIYDDFGGLVYVIPPEATRLLPSQYYQEGSMDATKDAFMERWAFRYAYDGRRRMTQKQVPGAEPVYMVYDKRDRLVLTQDGNQRTSNQWTFTKYDKLNRPILSGIYTDNTNIGLDAMQTALNNFYNSNPDKFFEIRGSTVHGYSSQSFPNAVSNEADYLTVTYYDDYEFDEPQFFGYDANPLAAQGQVAQRFDRVKGLVTGTKVKNLDDNSWLWTVNHYDDRYRAIQSVSQNHRGGINRITSVYDFVGRVLHTKTTHTIAGEAETSVTRSFEYDHAGRLLETWHKVGDTNVLLAKNEYNELGQLVTKKLHSEDQGSTFKQHVDYRYNIRGWNTRINNADLNSSDGGPQDYFGMEFGYNNDLGVGTFTPQYNGNISAAKWSANLGLGLPYLNEPTQRAYKFEYDPLGRLTKANHTIKTSSWLTTSANQEIISYDLNGNIETLLRSNNKGALIDWLTYDYGSGLNRSNRLLSVTDNSSGIEGFKDGNTSGNDYGYDANGNLTSDKNKKLENIKYNPYLNLTEEIVKDNGEKVKYIYDAEGIKLAEEIYKAGEQTPVKRLDYVGSMVYENDTLKFIVQEEGKVVIPKDQSGPEYQYQVKDHLGNVRLTFTTKEKTDVFQATMEDTGIADYSNPRVQEMVHFGNLFETEIRNVNQWLNHTSNAIGNAIYMDGSEDRTIGPYTMLKVYPGDTVKMEVFGKFENESSHSTMPLIDLLVALVTPVQTAAIGFEGGGTFAPSSFFEGLIPFLSNRGSTSDVPAAYLNYILFDKDFNVVDLGFDRIDESAGFDVLQEATVSFDKMQLERIIDRVGYLYVYVSNESEGSRVWMDDIKITYGHSPIVQFEDYYPFGLSISGTAFERGNDNYKGMVTADGTGLKDLGFRQYDAALGRFHAVDPLAELQADQSSYQYAGNNPVNQIDVLGLEADDHDKEKNKPKPPKRKQHKEERSVNGKKVKVHNGFVNKAQKPRGNTQTAQRKKEKSEKKEATASRKKESNGEQQASADKGSSSDDGPDPAQQALISMLFSGPQLNGGREKPGKQSDVINPFINPNGNTRLLHFENSVTPPDAFDERHDNGMSPLVYAASLCENVTDVEKNRQYLYSHLSANEARALYQRMLVSWNYSYQTNWLKENLAAVSNTSTSEEDVLDQDDQPLTRQQLQVDPRYAPLTTQSLRNKAQQACPGCAEYQRNIVAGNALEYAWSYWSGKPRNTDKAFKNDVRTNRVRPDFVYAKGEKGINNEGKPDLWIYPYGVFVEVKASQNPIDKTAFNKQIWGELNALSKQKNSASYTYFKDLFKGKKAEDGVLSFYLVVTEGTEIAQSLIDEATSLGITFFVSYAYENLETGGIVFSVPERKNFFNIEGVHMQMGIEQPQEGVQLDWDRAIPSWTWSNEYDESQP